MGIVKSHLLPELLGRRYKSFLEVLEEMHMLTEYLDFYGEGQEQIENLAI